MVFVRQIKFRIKFRSGVVQAKHTLKHEFNKFVLKILCWIQQLEIKIDQRKDNN